MKNIYVYPNQSPKQIHRMIVKVFGVKDYTVLNCNGRRHTLTVAVEQNIDGNLLRKYRGSLYLCEKILKHNMSPADSDLQTNTSMLMEVSEEHSSSESELEPYLTPKRQKDQQQFENDQEASNDTDHDDVEVVDLTEDCNAMVAEPVGTSSTPLTFSEAQTKLSSLPLVTQDEITNLFTDEETEDHIEEFRRIRREQDDAFEESLRIDSQKDEDVTRNMQREELIHNSREALQVKYKESKSRPIQITFRLPNGSRMEYSFDQADVTKKLYEFVFCIGDVNHGFTISKIIPREDVPCSDTLTLQQSNIKESCILTIQFNDDDIMKLLNLEQHQEKCHSAEELDTLDALDPAVAKRINFIGKMDTHRSELHLVKRSNIYEDVMALFDKEDILNEYPLRISFTDELAIDAGGVCRELFSAFWEVAYKYFFEGDSLLIPTLHPEVDMAALPKLGKIISHGYLASGFLPTHIVFPALAHILLGVTVEILSSIVVESFAASLSSFDASVVKQALSSKDKSFSDDIQSKLLYIFSQYGCRVCPKPLELRDQINSIAKYALLAKPMAAFCAISSGIPATEKDFWLSYSIKDLYGLYLTLTGTPGKVLSIIEEPVGANPCEMHTFGYLRQYIGNMRKEDIPRFLRFSTGSSVIISKTITITFNRLSGLSRRPIAHTCSSTLELPSTYFSYLDFEQKFNLVLVDDQHNWQMLAI